MCDTVYAAGMLIASLASVAAAAQAADLTPPFRVEAAGTPISVDVGHAHARQHDVDGDGLRDLVIGQFGSGKCRIYRNTGSDAAPAFESFAWMMAGDQPASVAAS